MAAFRARAVGKRQERIAVRSCLLAVVMAGVCLLSRNAFAWNAPEDAAGPLTVRIEAAEKIRETDTPQSVRVVLENKGESPLAGTVRLGVIDAWRADPAGPMPFEIGAHDTAALDFAVTAGQGTYNALYPIHAFAELEIDGKRYTAHPVLIVETLLPNPPRPEVSMPWKLIAVSENSVLSLARLPMRRVIVQVFGEAPLVQPPGWHGAEQRSRAHVQCSGTASRPDAREVIQMHPPWYGGHVGTLVIEFPLRLPDTKPIRLTFANAIRDHNVAQGEPPSDGVTFRVRALAFDAEPGQLGNVLFERHTDAKAWEEAEADLSPFAGKAVRLQLEVHPGPDNDTTCDHCYWAEPRLVAGVRPDTTLKPTGPARLLGVLAHVRGVTHADDHGKRYHVSVVPGSRGLLDAAVFVEFGQNRLMFRGFSATVLGDSLEKADAVSTLEEVAELPSNEGYRVRHTFSSWAGGFDLVGELRVVGSALRACFTLANEPEPKPWHVVYLEDVAAGPWNAVARRVYGGPGNVIEDPEAFVLGYDGHRLATSFVGFDFDNGMSMIQAVDVPPNHLEVTPGARRYTLHTPHTQVITFIPCANVWEGAEVWRAINGLEAAGGVKQTAGRFVFDLWGGHYGPSADQLERAFRYGLTDSMVVWHNWQRWGYDYRLPDIYPPNPSIGSLEEFQRLAQVCKDHGVVFAPHDNYIDFYPDAEGYSYNHIAFTPDRAPVRAWLNRGREAQSYRWRADAVQPFLERNLALVREYIAPTGYFIDVWSSIRPYDYWTHDGSFFDRVYTRTRWGEYFAWIRDYLGGNAPTISESGHDQLIGWLDGAQTNHLRVDPSPPGETWLVWRLNCGDAERVPWFDAAHHDRFILHGAGYGSRYSGGLDGRLHGIYSDDYICTEVLTGHPAMVPAPFGRDVVRKYWLQHEPMRALALRVIDNVEFVNDDIHRQHVRWDSGGGVWVNRGQDDWAVQGRVLPDYGFYARIPGEVGLVEAAIERRDGVIVEWCRAPGYLYVNARPHVTDRLPVRVALDAFRCVGERTCELTFRWQADTPLPEDCRVFVHCVDAGGKIAFQGDHDPLTPTSQWRGAVLSTTSIEAPDSARPGGAYDLRVGLYSAAAGQRFSIEGPADGEQRIRLGTVTLLEDGVTWTPLEEQEDAYLARINVEGKAVDFDGVTTDGACRITREDDVVMVTPLPNGPAFNVALDWPALKWDRPSPRYAQAIAEDGSELERMPLECRDGLVVLRCEPEVFAYRLMQE